MLDAHRRGRIVEANLMQSDALAEETHTGRVWSLVILPAVLGPALSVVFYPTQPARIAFVVVCVMGFGATTMAWAGFRYRFLQDAVEISTIGFRLRSIPRQDIVSYAVESWSFMRGYGIRGIGRVRAYTWGNKVVHITTKNGEVFLGHSDPERIVRDLDLVTGFSTPRR